MLANLPCLEQAAAKQDQSLAFPLPMPFVSPADGESEENTAWKQEALQRQVSELQQERASLVHDLALAKSDLSKTKLQGKSLLLVRTSYDKFWCLHVPSTFLTISYVIKALLLKSPKGTYESMLDVLSKSLARIARNCQMSYKHTTTVRSLHIHAVQEIAHILVM